MELLSFEGGITEKNMSIAACRRYSFITKIAFPVSLIALGTCCLFALLLLFCVLKLLDVKRPIVGSFQKQQEVIPMPANSPTFAIVEISENIRAKLYLLLCKLGKTNELPCQCHICH